MSGASHWTSNPDKTGSLIQVLGGVHCAERFNITMSEAEFARCLQTHIQDRASIAFAAAAWEKVHLLQFTGISITTFKWRYSGTSDDHAIYVIDKVGGPVRIVRAEKVTYFRVMDRKPWTASAEFRHHLPDYSFHGRIIPRCYSPDSYTHRSTAEFTYYLVKAFANGISMRSEAVLYDPSSIDDGTDDIGAIRCVHNR